MKIKILSTGQGPDYYTFAGETVTAHQGGVSEAYDLSAFPEGGTFTGADPVNGVPAIRHVERTGGVLTVTLCQQVGAGHWGSTGLIDTTAYDPDAIMVPQDTSKPHAGVAWAKTRRGKVSAETGDVLA